MNRVPGIVRNPAYVEELEPDGDEVDPVDLSPFIEGTHPSSPVPLQRMKEQMELKIFHRYSRKRSRT